MMLFIKKKVFIVVIWRLHFTWKNVNFQQLFVVVKMTERRKSQSEGWTYFNLLFIYFITVNKYGFCISVIGYINMQIIGIGYKKIYIGRSLLETLPNNMWWWRCCLTIFLRFSDPKTQFSFFNSPAVILEESLATQTLLLTVHLDEINTCPYPGSFVTIYVDWKFLIIVLMVEMGIFTALVLFSKRLD